MNTIVLSYFIEVCKTLNFSKAAENLYLSPQGVGKAVKSLEEELGQALFARTSQGLALTKFGLALQQSAEKILAETASLKQKFTFLATEDNQRVSIGIAMGVEAVMGADFVARIRAMDLDADLVLADSWDLFCEHEVEAGGYDLAITCGPADHRAFDMTVLYKGYMCALVHHTHPLYTKEVLSVRELLEEQFIITNKNYRLYHQFSQACRHHGFEPKIVGATIDVGATCLACPDRRIIGISAYPIQIKYHYDGFRPIPIMDEVYYWELDLITKKGHALPPQAEKARRLILGFAGIALS